VEKRDSFEDRLLSLLLVLLQPSFLFKGVFLKGFG